MLRWQLIIYLRNKQMEIYLLNMFKENKQIPQINNHLVEMMDQWMKKMTMMFINDNYYS